ncbi:MAG TPA: hypothetical protein VGK73_33945 [Polyangiaceae bacterium]
MNAIKKFRNIWKFLVPGWLQSGQGELVLFVQGMLKDAFSERAHQTARLHAPSLCTSDALDFHGRSRALPRGLFEPEENYRGRLVAWRYPEGHRTRGTAGALLAQFQLALRGTHHVVIDARNKRTIGGSGAALPSNWDWDAMPADQWGRYWLVCESIGAPWPSFSDPGWLAAWEDPNAVLAGSGIAYGELDAVLRIASNSRLGWTPAGIRPQVLTLYFDGQDFPEPTGDWDTWANRDPQYRYVSLNENVP